MPCLNKCYFLVDTAASTAIKLCTAYLHLVMAASLRFTSPGPRTELAIHTTLNNLVMIVIIKTSDKLKQNGGTGQLRETSCASW